MVSKHLLQCTFHWLAFESGFLLLQKLAFFNFVLCKEHKLHIHRNPLQVGGWRVELAGFPETEAKLQKWMEEQMEQTDVAFPV